MSGDDVDIVPGEYSDVGLETDYIIMCLVMISRLVWRLTICVSW